MLAKKDTECCCTCCRSYDINGECNTCVDDSTHGATQCATKFVISTGDEDTDHRGTDATNPTEKPEQLSNMNETPATSEESLQEGIYTEDFQVT